MAPGFAVVHEVPPGRWARAAHHYNWAGAEVGPSRQVSAASMPPGGPVGRRGGRGREGGRPVGREGGREGGTHPRDASVRDSLGLQFHLEHPAALEQQQQSH